MIEAYDLTFMGQNVRQAQDNRLVSLALMNSLAPAGKRSNRLQANLYMVNSEMSANRLLRTIIQTSHMDLLTDSGKDMAQSARLHHMLELDNQK